MKIARLVPLLAAATVASAFAQDHIQGIAAEPNPAKAGQPVRITVTGDTDPAVYCGLLTGFGDGSDQRSVVGQQEGSFPKVTTHTYAAPGTYTIRADGRKVDGRFGCTGKVKAQLVVEPPPAAAKPAVAEPAKGAAAVPACPEGYALKGKAGKAGDFTCTAGKDAKKPEKVMDCADGLEYFQTRTTVGCRRLK